MLVDTDVLNLNTYHKIKNFVRKIIMLTDTADMYIKYRLYLPIKDSMSETQIIDKHVINWLYTIKCESGAIGIRYIDIVLFGLKKTLKRDLDNLQFEYVKALIYIFLTERKLYYGYNRRNLA